MKPKTLDTIEILDLITWKSNRKKLNLFWTWFEMCKAQYVSTFKHFNASNQAGQWYI